MTQGCSLEHCLLAKIFIELVTIFCNSPETNFIFCNTLEHLGCGATKFHVYKMIDAVHRREHAKHVLETRFYSSYLTCYTGNELNEIGNLFITFHFNVDSLICLLA